MLQAYTFWSAHYNEVIVIIATNQRDAIKILNDTYISNGKCETNDWIIGSSMSCIKGQSLTVNIIK